MRLSLASHITIVHHHTRTNTYAAVLAVVDENGGIVYKPRIVVKADDIAQATIELGFHLRMLLPVVSAQLREHANPLVWLRTIAPPPQFVIQVHLL